MVLEQSVSQQVDIFGQLPTMKACGFPNVSGLSLLTSFQFGQHIFSAVATTGSANFPEVLVLYLKRPGVKIYRSDAL